MNSLFLNAHENFKAGTCGVEQLGGQFIKVPNGVLMFCTDGEADITIDLRQYHIVPNTNIILLPGSIFSLESGTNNLCVHFFVYSEEMFRVANFRLDPAFIHFLRENACYTHTDTELLTLIRGLAVATECFYRDTANRFRENIAQNLLQIFFLNTYDKVQRFFTPEQISGSNRKDQLFKRFISLIRTHCTTQRDVTFYARELCISTRYLSEITKRMGQESAKSIIDDFLMLELKVALQSTDYSLKEIADRYHFPDQSFFGRYFKKHTGLSPKEYRAGKRLAEEKAE